ncbi:MAG TPA: metal-dependent hydrolase [Alphaproteobacteria bacterium]|nr:metal-dependent hydrolase [Alphaproteobacteria bacterium]HNS44665.1 metal-dependent hydrolase [Alphaproteobacteria bacterium]
MDTLTHMAVGAAIGQVIGYSIGYKKLGSKALLAGAVGGFVPDLDIFIAPVAEALGHHDEFMGWKYHRHFTHSLWFGPVLGSLLGWAAWRHYGRQAGHLWPWIAILVLGFLAHPLLDFCTIYGTQLLAPFSNHRFYISAVSIIDPVFTLPLLLAVLLSLFSCFRPCAKGTAIFALGFSLIYLAYGYYLNTKAEAIARTQLAEQKVSYDRLDAYTTIFQPFLRRVVVWQTDNVLRVGFVSTFSPSPIFWTCKAQVPEDMRQQVLATDQGKIFDWFSIGTLNMAWDESGQRIVVTDARYGVPGPSVFGWWGLEFLKNDDGTLRYMGKMRVERDASWTVIGQLFRASYGLPNNFLPNADEGCSN